MSKKVWEEYPEIWKTEAYFMSWLRGNIRRSLWSHNPVKVNFIKHNRIRIPNPNPKGRVAEVWGAKCALTGAILPLKDMEVDHKVGEHSLRSLNDLQSFIEGLICVSEDDLQFLSKEAHKAKTLQERNNISFEEAKATKQAIALLKDKKKELEWWKKHDMMRPSNAKDRRQAIINTLLGQSK